MISIESNPFFGTPLHNLESDPERALRLVPVGAQHLEASYLTRRAHVLADAGTHVVVADAHQSDGLAGIVGQPVQRNVLGQIVARHELERHRQVLLYQFLHPALYLPLLLSRGLVVQVEAHLALLPLHVGIIAATAAKQPDHRLVQQVLRGMRWRKFLLVVLVQYIVFHCFKLSSLLDSVCKLTQKI